MRIHSALALLLLAACGPVDVGGDRSDGGDVPDAAGRSDGSDTPDASDVPDAGDAPDAGEQPDAGDTPDGGFVAGDPITAPAETWTYVPFPDAKCGNGTETGIGVNLKPGATTLVVHLQGGGACWEVGACYIMKTATHVEDVVQQAVVLNESLNVSRSVLFDRLDVTNPLRDAHQVYVPYCTGDLHAGTRVQRYEALGQVRDLHHVGALNMEAYLRRLVPTMAGVERVVLAGISAGGYGTLFHWWRFQEAFGPSVRVDVLDDSGIPVSMAWDRFGTASAAWAIAWPPGCTDCATGGFSKLLPYYASTMTAPHRFGLLAFRDDNVIASYFGLQTVDIRNGLDALKAATPANQRFYLLDGTSHVLADQPGRTTSSGTTVRDWIRAFVTDDATWTHAGP